MSKLTKEQAKALWDGFTDEQRAEVKQMRAAGAAAPVAFRAVAEKAKDPGAYDVNAAPETSVVDDYAVATGAVGDVLGFGLADKAAGVMRAGGRAVMTGDTSHIAEDYTAGRDAQRDATRLQAKISPNATTAGNVIGTAAQFAMPGAAAPSLGRAIASGMGLGALSGLGEDEGDTLMNIAEGAGRGAVFGGAGYGVAKGIPAVTGALKSKRLSGLNLGGLIADAAEEIPVAGKLVKAGRRLASAFDDAPKVVDDVVLSADDAGAVLDDLAMAAEPSNLALARPPPMPRERAAVNFLAPVDDVAEAAAPVVDDVEEVVAARVAQEMPTAPQALKRPAKAWANATDDDKIAVLEKAAQNAVARFGTADRAAIQSATGMPNADLDRLLPNVARRVASTPAAAPVSIPAAKQAARAMPAVAPDEGLPARAVAAANQGAELRAAFDALPPEQRAGFVRTLLQSMPADVVKRRLGLSDKQWRLFSFDRVQPEVTP